MKSGKQNANMVLDRQFPLACRSKDWGDLTRRIVEGSRDCLKVLTLEGKLCWINKSGRQLLAIDDPARVLDRNWTDFWDGEARQQAQAALEQARAGGAGRFQGFCATLAGQPRWWDVMVSPILDDRGRPEWIFVVSRDITEQHDAQAALARLEWLLQGMPAPGAEHVPSQPPGDLAQLNSCRLIRDAVGEQMLREIAADYMDLLQTSTAIYEKNGEYAMGLFSSGWCRYLDHASRCRCQTGDSPESLACGHGLCHECCWHDSAKRAIQTGGPVDIECPGGIRLYALPIKAGEEIVGAINFGYGDPPRDPASLRRIAERYGVDAGELHRHAVAYESRPPFLIELAKRRLATSARLIGEIVRRRQAELDRQSSESAFRDLFESASDVILMLDAEGRILDINPHAVRLTGYTRQELLGKNVLTELVIPEDREKVTAVFNCLLRGERQRYEVRWRARDGRVLWFEGISTACLNEHGAFRNTRCILRDMTERKKAEEALRASEAKFRAIFDQAAMGIALTDLEGHLLMANQKFSQIVGRPAEDMLRLNVADFSHPEDVDATRDNLRRLRAGEIDHYTYSKRYVRPDGAEVWCQLAVSGIRDGEGRLRYTLGVIEDITERKRAVEELLEREERLRILTNNLPWIMVYQMIHEPGRQRRFSFVSASVERLHEVTVEAVLNDPGLLYSQVHPDFLPDLQAAEEEAERTMSHLRYEMPIRLPSGRTRWAEVSSVPRRLPGGMLIWDGVEVDITERKQAEAALRGIVEGTSQATGEQFFRNLVQHLAQTLGVCCAMVSEVDRACPDRARMLAMWTGGGFAENHEYPLAGTPCAEILHKTACHYYHHVAELFPGDEALRTMGAESYVGTPLRDSAGNVLGLIAILHDRPLAESQLAESMLAIFSARAATELERLQAERDLGDALRRKDEFLAMLGHELRNPLAPIRSTVHLLRQNAGALTPRRERGLAVISRQTEHLTRLVDDLLDMARITRGAVELKKQRTSLAEAITKAIEMTTPQIEARGHALTTTLPPRAVAVEADPVRLTQIFGNLLDNAAKYTDPGGRITVAAALEDHEAVVRVRDTGMGISPEMQRHVFDLFAQGHRALDRSQGGLGLGLTLVRQLCQMHGGSVSVWSEGPGRGSEFTVRLPVLQETPADSDREAPPAEPKPEQAACRRVLVVDDVADTAESLAELIGLWDYDVKVALDGPAALEAAAQFHPDVVLLDIGLPGMDGYEVARQIRRDPALAPVQLIALTGYGQEEDRRIALEAGFDRHLVKPVDLNLLRRELEQRTAGVQ